MNEEREQLFRTVSELPWGDTLLRDLFGTTPPGNVVPPPPEKNDRPDDRGESRLSAEQSALLASIQLELRVDIGELRLTIAELLDLVPGQVFRSSLEPSQPLILRIGDSEIARARLIRVQGQLSLEIVSVLGADSGEQSSLSSRKEGVSEHCAQQPTTEGTSNA